VYSNVDLIGPRGELYHLGFLDIMPGPHPKRSIFECLAADMFVIPSATLVSKKVFLEVGGFDERLSGYEDDDLFIRIFFQGYGNVYLNQSLTQWRLHSGSCSRSMRFAESRMIYAKKLLATYTDNRELGLYFHNNFILPRFINIIISEWYRALSADEKILVRRLQDDLQTLLPYMNVSLKIKSSIMAFLLRTIGRHPFFRPVMKLYRLVEMVSRRLRLAYA
jgi:GT2 family glycosyltransferase